MLDPQRFSKFDAAINKATSFLSSKLLAQPTNTSDMKGYKPSYAKLEKFQGYREQLASICADLIQMLQVEKGNRIFPSVLEDDVRQLTQQIKSQKFRLAIVGEFSRGKSTLLNALLGEEVQPVRTVPCSGTLAVLKHGAKKRVVCHYKDGTQSVIPFDQYQQHASIPKESALGKRGFAPEKSNIVEIVLEHPGLELCRHHVEIVDSPGLNDHPDRTDVTERLMQNADAALFLTHSQQLLNKNEQNLLQDLKYHLQKKVSEAPADNLFVIVNHMDVLRSPEDKADVVERTKNIVRDPAAPLVKDDNRVHFISAQVALEGILQKTTNEHSESFSKFMNALETFLVEERGELVLRKEIANVQRLILATHNGIKQTADALEGNLNSSTEKQHQTLEGVSAISGLDVGIQNLSKDLLDEMEADIHRSWRRWQSRLEDRLSQASYRWTTSQKDEEEIIKDYIEQFNKDISKDVDKQLRDTLRDVVEPGLNKLDSSISEKLAVVGSILKSVDHSVNSSSHEQLSLLSVELTEFQSTFVSRQGTATFFKSVAAIANMLVIGLITRAIVDFISGESAETRRHKLRKQVIEKCLTQFSEKYDEIVERLIKEIRKAFEERTDKFHREADSAISILCNLLEQQENAVERKSEQKEIGTSLMRQKTLQVQAIETALGRLTKTALI